MVYKVHNEFIVKSLEIHSLAGLDDLFKILRNVEALYVSFHIKDLNPGSQIHKFHLPVPLKFVDVFFFILAQISPNISLIDNEAYNFRLRIFELGMNHRSSYIILILATPKHVDCFQCQIQSFYYYWFCKYCV